MNSQCFEIYLSPLDAKIADRLAECRGVDISQLISTLLREEAVIELVGWRDEIRQSQSQIRANSSQTISSRTTRKTQRK